MKSLLLSAFMLPGLDCCNSVLAKLPQSTIDPLQQVLNAAAQHVVDLRPLNHLTPALKQRIGCPSNTESDI